MIVAAARRGASARAESSRVAFARFSTETAVSPVPPRRGRGIKTIPSRTAKPANHRGEALAAVDVRCCRPAGRVDELRVVAARSAPPAQR